MTTPTIEDVARTICLAAWGHDYTPRNQPHADVRWAEAMRAAEAVIDERFGPMLAYVRYDTANNLPKYTQVTIVDASEYAARILEQMKEKP